MRTATAATAAAPATQPGRRGLHAVAILVAVVAGLAVVGQVALAAYRSATDPTRPQAEQLGMRLSSSGSIDPEALTRVAQHHGDVLEAEDISPCHLDTVGEVGCSTLLVRLDTEVQEGWFAPAPERVVRCWRYTLQGSVYDHVPKLVDCPDDAEPRPPVPPEPPAPELPDGMADRLQLTLTALVDAGTVDPDTVRTAVEAVAGGPPARVEVDVVDGDLGVVVALTGGAECVAGRIVDGVDGATVEAWHVPRVLAQPGEGGCGAAAAATGASARSPH